jgi:hypothetical protein
VSVNFPAMGVKEVLTLLHFLVICSSEVLLRRQSQGLAVISRFEHLLDHDCHVVHLRFDHQDQAIVTEIGIRSV